MKFTVGQTVKKVKNEAVEESGVKTMAEFKIGDKAVHLEECSGGTPTGLEAIFDGHNFHVDTWNCGHLSTWKLVSEAKTDMSNFIELSELEKENLSEDAQALRRVGVITPDLRVYSSDNLLHRLLKLNFKALAAQAKKEIAFEEAKEEKSKQGK